MTESSTAGSWWTERMDHAAFAQRVARELPRMRTSKGASYVDTYHAIQSRERGSVGMGTHRKGRFQGVTVSR